MADDTREPDEPADDESQAREQEKHPPHYWNNPVEGESPSQYQLRISVEAKRRAVRISRWVRPRYAGNQPTVLAFVMLTVWAARTLGIALPRLLMLVCDQWERSEAAERQRLVDAVNAAMLASVPHHGKEPS